MNVTVKHVFKGTTLEELRAALIAKLDFMIEMIPKRELKKDQYRMEGRREALENVKEFLTELKLEGK